MRTTASAGGEGAWKRAHRQRQRNHATRPAKREHGGGGQRQGRHFKELDTELKRKGLALRASWVHAHGKKKEAGPKVVYVVRALWTFSHRRAEDGRQADVEIPRQEDDVGRGVEKAVATEVGPNLRADGGRTDGWRDGGLVG